LLQAGRTYTASEDHELAQLMAKHVLPHFNPHRRVALDELSAAAS